MERWMLEVAALSCPEGEDQVQVLQWEEEMPFFILGRKAFPLDPSPEGLSHLSAP
jgi:hypothetical protein